MITLCKCGCGQPARRNWASIACYKIYRNRDASHHQSRAACFERDGGICVLCACDTMELRRKYIERLHLRFPGEIPALMDELHPEIRDAGFPSLRHSWWQADHENPLSEGGGHTGGNWRTLCVRCHKLETSRLMARLAEKRRAGGTMELAL